MLAGAKVERVGVGVASVQPLRSGDPTHFGRFKLVGRLGAGGMGVAFAAETAQGARVVIKTVLSDFSDDIEFRRRFKREVLAASSIESPFVCEVLASDLSADRQWVALEYIEGPTLHTLVKSQGPLSEARQVALAAGLAHGLSELHGCGLVHRDLKPSNIICAQDGPRLIDFGIAVMQQLPGVTRSGHLAPGSPGWMAPEQLDPYSVPTPALDLFSWACTCWFAATGESPFSAASSAESLAALRKWSADALEMPASLAGPVAPLVRQALAADPDQRGSAEQMATALAFGMGGDTVAKVTEVWRADPTARIDHTLAVTAVSETEAPHRRPVRRWRFALVATCLILLVGAGAVAVALTQGLGIAASLRSRQPTSSSAADSATTPSHAEGSSAPAQPPPQVAVPSADPSGGGGGPALAGRPDPGYGGRWVGYGPVKLGMTRAQLLSTGETLDVARTPELTCTDYPLRSGGYAAFSERLHRVVFINFDRDMATSRGVRMGAPSVAVARAYPGHVADAYGEITVGVAPHVYYLIGMSAGYVSELVLMSDRQDCAG